MSEYGSEAERAAAADFDAKRKQEKALKMADRIFVEGVAQGTNITHEQATKQAVERIQQEISAQDIDRQRQEFLAGQVKKAEQAEAIDKERGDWLSKVS